MSGGIVRPDDVPRRTSERLATRTNEVLAALRGRHLPQLAPVAPGLKKGSVAPTIAEFLCGGQRRTPPGPLPSTSPLAALGAAARDRPARHVARALDGAPRDRRACACSPIRCGASAPRRSRFAGPKRFQPVPVPIAALPPLDAVVVSHDHYDHLDYPTILALAQRDVPFVTSLGVGAHLEAWGVPAERITELDWWESVELPRRADHHRRAVAALLRPRRSAIATARCGRRSRCAGRAARSSSAATPGSPPSTPRSAQRLGPFDLVMLEVGAFHPSVGRHPPRARERARGARAARRRQLPAGALGHLQPRDPRVGRAGRDAARARAGSAACSS